MSGRPRLLVVDGYAREGREDLTAGGATTAGVLYQRMLERCAPGAEIEIVHPADPDVALPTGTAIADWDGIAWTGSSLTIFADDPRVTPQIEFARQAYAAGVPGFGSCWAAQIAVVAAGGRCAVNPKGREMGIARKIALTAEGRAHPLYLGKPSVFDGFISHDDEVTHLPPSGLLLATNRHTHVQSVAVTHRGGSFWGLQYHPEYDLHELARLIHCRRQKLIGFGFFADLEAADEHVAELEALYQDPSRKDLAWRLGLDEDVMSEDIRVTEVRNWIEQLVLPNMRP
jgi:GMP synthase (glutamine-hydrolysing)